MRESPPHARPARCLPGRGTQPSWRQNLAHSLGYDVSDIAFARQRKLSQQLPWRFFRAERNHSPTMGALAIFAAQILRLTYSTSARQALTRRSRTRFFASGASHSESVRSYSLLSSCIVASFAVQTSAT